MQIELEFYTILSIDSFYASKYPLHAQNHRWMNLIDKTTDQLEPFAVFTFQNNMRKKDGARNVSKTIHADARRGRRANRSGFERTNAVPSFHRGERRARDVEGTEQGRRTRDNEQQRPVSMQRLSEEALRRHAAQMREQRERAARMKNALKKEMDDFVQTGPKVRPVSWVRGGGNAKQDFEVLFKARRASLSSNERLEGTE